MSGLDILIACGVAFMVFTAAVLGAAETALIRVSRARAESLIERDEDARTSTDLDGKTSRLRQVVERRELMVNTIFFVVLACHLGIATVLAVLVHDAWGAGAVAIAFVVELLVLYGLVGVPRTLAILDLNSAAPFAAGLAKVLAAIPPLRLVAGGVTAIGQRLGHGDQADSIEVSEEELLALAHQAAQSEAIDADEQQYIESIIEFGDTVARQVMSPRPDMVAVAHDVRIVDVADVVIANGYSRIPVFTETVDDIVGIAHSKDIMRAQRDGAGEHLVSTIMRKPNVVPETKKISTLLNEMQAETFHMAIVVDEHGGTAGLLTMEDVIEEVVGEIVDEFDVEQPMIERLQNGYLLVNGKAELDELEVLLDTELPEGEWSTVGGLIFSTLGHVPEPAESLVVNGHRFLVQVVQGRRIARVLVSPLPLDVQLDETNDGEASPDAHAQEISKDRVQK